MSHYLETFLQYYQRGYCPSLEDFLKTIVEDQQHTAKQWYHKVVNQQYLWQIAEQTEVEEIVYQEKTLLNRAEFELSLELLCLQNKAQWNHQAPFASFTKKHGEKTFRLTLIHGNCTQDQNPRLYLRNLNYLKLQYHHFDAPDILNESVQSKKNILIAGATGSGKTALLNVMVQSFHPDEHTVILEDTQEIQQLNKLTTHLVADGQNKTLNDYCSYALRMSPQRIILGEMRSKEVIPFLLAMNTGHQGLISTIHSNSASDALHRLGLLYSLYQNSAEIPFSTIMQYICKNIDQVVYLKDKKVVEIIQVRNYDQGHCIYQQLWTRTNNQTIKLANHA